MRISKLIIALMAFLSFAAWAESYTVSLAYEVAVKDMTLPSYTAGTISFKDCDACERRTIRVTSDTRYVLNKEDVTLADFRIAVNSIANKDTNIATVIHLSQDSPDGSSRLLTVVAQEVAQHESGPKLAGQITIYPFTGLIC